MQATESAPTESTSDVHPLPEPLWKARLNVDGRTAAWIFAGLMILYQLNGQFTPTADSTPNVYLPVSILTEGDLTFTPEGQPHMFHWLRAGEGDQPAEEVYIERWTDAAPSGKTWGELREAGSVVLQGPRYYVSPSVDVDRLGYVNTFGAGVGLFSTPFYAFLSLIVEDLPNNKPALFFGSKFLAAFCVAASAVFVFLAARRFVRPAPATAIAVMYGLGTCVWAVAAQSLRQSPPNLLFLSMACYCLVNHRRHLGWALGCGAAAACAVWMRPTSAAFVVAVAVYLAVEAWLHWKKDPQNAQAAFRPLSAYLLAGAPFALLLFAYNWCFHGGPLTFADITASETLAMQKHGSPDVWQTPFFTGFYGHLFSPSRGMLVYSPVLLLAMWGAARVWAKRRYAVLRPLSAAFVAMLLVQSKWFEWHGGWTFGYRLMIDSLPMLVLCAAAVVREVQARRALQAAVAAACVWSVGVQILGAHAYDVIGWNNRVAYVVTSPELEKPVVVQTREEAAPHLVHKDSKVQTIHQNVDLKPFQHRLWSIRDSQLVYYATHFRQSRQVKDVLIKARLKRPDPPATDKQASR